ncbi:uncharacterized protein BJ171DRAFT_489680 [Polychytrium aggregatum]|uniref:uncharacterized protein n=1 Tax=Polychytrium aggregatum TaxID=110093 RepID=UPI0022FE7A50|nr:uncharacterized protein BJ171DRAFT_489680 [Polychytrium aggregatum]KAI9208684.1 hypothetical protein BJ171DRAFT_489680 [Polychytrium aggregatum]
MTVLGLGQRAVLLTRSALRPCASRWPASIAKRLKVSATNTNRSPIASNCVGGYGSGPSPVSLGSLGLGATLAKSSPKKTGGLKHLLKEYGPVAFITYMGVSTVSLTIWYTAITFGLDVDPVLAQITQATSWFWTSGEEADALEICASANIDEVSAEHKDESLEDSVKSAWAKAGTTLLVAIAAHNLIVPLRLGLTAMLTPAVAARMRALGLEFWMKKK